MKFLGFCYCTAGNGMSWVAGGLRVFFKAPSYRAAGGGVSFLHDFNGLAQKPIRQKGNAEAKKMRRCPPSLEPQTFFENLKQ